MFEDSSVTMNSHLSHLSEDELIKKEDNITDGNITLVVNGQQKETAVQKKS